MQNLENEWETVARQDGGWPKEHGVLAVSKGSFG